MPLPAAGVFALLRSDGQFAAAVSTVHQAAVLAGLSPEQLIGRDAAWAGSDVDRERQRRAKKEAIEAYRRDWGVPPPGYA